jgi:hypothetical protein
MCILLISQQQNVLRALQLVLVCPVTMAKVNQALTGLASGTQFVCACAWDYAVVKAGGIFLFPRIFPSYFLKILQQIFWKNVLRNIS